jgi:hypothetical protein
MALGNLGWIKSGTEHPVSLGVSQPSLRLGPMPVVEDVCGHGPAIQVLLNTLEPGKYHDSHSQFDTIRKMRSSFANVWATSSRDADGRNRNIG